MEPGNKDLQQRAQQVQSLRDADKATVPCTLQEEHATNPFLRPDSANIRSTLSVKEGAPDVEAFAAIRKHKDNF